MTNVIAFLHSFFAATQDKFQDREDRGATAVEYGLMVGLIAVVIIAAVGLLGTTGRPLRPDRGRASGRPRNPPHGRLRR